jgi:hypothetical protein
MLAARVLRCVRGGFARKPASLLGSPSGREADCWPTGGSDSDESPEAESACWYSGGDSDGIPPRLIQPPALPRRGTHYMAQGGPRPRVAAGGDADGIVGARASRFSVGAGLPAP